MKVLQIGVFSVLLVFLAGCSSTSSDRRIDYGAEAKQVPTLEMPPDLTAPIEEQRYKLPQGDSGVVATYSEYSKGGIVQNPAANAVLSAVPSVRLERNGAQRWMVVRDSAGNVWSVVRAFLLELGLTIKSEEPAAGVIETDWMENRAKLPQSKIRNAMGDVYDKAFTFGERDQYLVRLERSKDGVSTEVYVTHRGMAEVLTADMKNFKWQLRANDPELEAIMLQRLMVRFGAKDVQAASAVAAVSAATSVPEPAGTARLQEAPNGGVIIVMNDAFDRSWRKVGLAIESAGLAVEDKNREKGTYFLRPIKIERSWLDALLWRANEVDNNNYRVNVKDGGAICEVSVTDQNGASNKITKQMAEGIFKHINKQ